MTELTKTRKYIRIDQAGLPRHLLGAAFPMRALFRPLAHSHSGQAEVVRHEAERYAACYRHPSLAPAPPLPAGWQQGDDRRYSIVGAPDLGSTTLDPRYLPPSWTMSLVAGGRPVFQYLDRPPILDDPRGAGPAWRMQIDGSSRAYCECQS